MEYKHLKISNIKQSILGIIVLCILFGISQTFIFLFLFAYADVAIVVFITTLLFVAAYFAIKAGNTDLSIIISHLAMSAHAFYMVFVFGWDYGYQYYLIMLIGLFYVNSFQGKYTAYIFAILEIALFVVLYVMMRILDWSMDYELVLFERNLSELYYFANYILACLILFLSTYIVSNNYLKFITDQSKQNILLEHDAQKDVLTGLNTRDAFMDNIEDIVNNGDKNTLYYLAMVDIDWFKGVNDKYGHAVGDEVLKKLAIIMQDIFGYKNVCRWGGEEFAIFGIENTKEMADGFNFLDKLEYLRTEFGSNDFIADNNSFKVTVSIGCVGVRDMTSIPHKINMADECLYKAKNSGKNKIVYKIFSKDGLSYQYGKEFNVKLS